MLCQKCKKYPATVNYVEIRNGKRFECNLCGACYADFYGETHSQTSTGLFSGLAGHRVPRAKSCPVCGTTYAEYEQTGLLGCTSCYDVFKEELIPYIRKIHGKLTHVGKRSENVDKHGLHRKLGELQERLEDALRAKRYREASALNRQIDVIKKSLEGGE